MRAGAKIKKLVESGAFASLGGAGRGDECMIKVCWTGYSPSMGMREGNSHLIRRGEVTADLGSPPPEPPFTNDEMQSIAYAAKGAAIKALMARRKAAAAARRQARASKEAP